MSDFVQILEQHATTLGWGFSYGNAANQLHSPRGVFVDDMGNVYVSDHEGRRIQKWLPGSNEGETIISNLWAQDVSVDVNGTIYVLGYHEQNVTKWIPGATSEETVAGGNLNGTALNQLSYPQGFHVDSDGNIYIADTNNHRIQKWEPEATKGITIAGGNVLRACYETSTI